MLVTFSFQWKPFYNIMMLITFYKKYNMSVSLDRVLEANLEPLK